MSGLYSIGPYQAGVPFVNQTLAKRTSKTVGARGWTSTECCVDPVNYHPDLTGKLVLGIKLRLFR